MEAQALRVNGRHASMGASPVQATHSNGSRRLQPAFVMLSNNLTLSSHFNRL